MRSIPGVVLGTYYPARAEGAAGVARVSDMRGLVYALKDNRDPPNPPQLILHPFHPSNAAKAVSRDNAATFVADIAKSLQKWASGSLGFALDKTVSLVPVPSSAVTPATIHTARWPSKKLAHQLAHRGLGQVFVLAVNSRPFESKVSGHVRGSQEVLDGLVRIADPPRGPVLFIDDVVTHGSHLAAIDRLLGRPQQPGVLALAKTESTPVADATAPRAIDVSYDDSVRRLVGASVRVR